MANKQALNPADLTKDVWNKTDNLFDIKPDSGTIGSSFSAMQSAGTSMLQQSQQELNYFLIFCVIAIVIFVFVVLSMIFTITIINKGAMVTPKQKNLTFYNGGGGGPGIHLDDPTGCPLVGGTVLPGWGSYDPSGESPGSGGSGHGSQQYWSDFCGGNAGCCYSTPQEGNCDHSNQTCNDSFDCNQCSNGSGCDTYGFSADIIGGPAGTPVYVPWVDGKERTWSCHNAFANGSLGFTVDCDTTDSLSPTVHMVLTHVEQISGTMDNLTSGDQVSTLFDVPSYMTPHVHLEVALDGHWVKPEESFCAGP